MISLFTSESLHYQHVDVINESDSKKLYMFEHAQKEKMINKHEVDTFINC